MVRARSFCRFLSLHPAWLRPGAGVLGLVFLASLVLVPRPLRAQESVEEAPVEAVEEAPVEVEELSVEELYAEGYRLFAGGDFEGARAKFEAVLDRQPDHRFARNYLAECLTILQPASPSPEESPPEAASPGAEPTDAEGGEPHPAPDGAGDTESPGSDGSKQQLSKVQKQLKNPRSDRRGAVGLGLFGPAIGVSVWGQWLPHWTFGLLGGTGGVVPTVSSSNSGLGAFFVEAHLLPIPWRLTPVLGIGSTMLLGGLVWQADAMGGVVAAAERFRLLVYGLVGVRFDARNGLMVSAGVGLLPSGDPEVPLVPLPSLRAGLRF